MVLYKHFIFIQVEKNNLDPSRQFQVVLLLVPLSQKELDHFRFLLQPPATPDKTQVYSLIYNKDEKAEIEISYPVADRVT